MGNIDRALAGAETRVDTVALMEAIPTPDDGAIAIVRDLLRGGTFIYDSAEIGNDNQGTNFSGWIRQYSGAVNVKWFGATGDSVTDDTASVKSALVATTGYTLYIPSGCYKITESLTIPEYTKIEGDKAPVLGVFPQLDDSKVFLRPNYKKDMPGTSLLFVGDGTNWDTHTTVRIDDFSSFTYLVMTEGAAQTQISEVSIILDVDVLDAGGTLTAPASDNSSTCDVGVAIVNNSKSVFKSMYVFGYFDKAGVVVSSEGDGDNPDYNSFHNCSFMGDYGIALIGDDVNDSYGLSGTQFYECNFFERDHHSRPADTIDGTNCGNGVMFIDGKTSAVSDNINGHYFYGGNFRTYSENGLRLIAASNIAMFGVTFEFTGTSDALWYGTSETSQVSIINCRNMSFIHIHHAEFDAVVDNIIVIQDSSYNGINVANQGLWTRMIHTGNRGKFQFTENPLISTEGWSIERAIGGSLEIRNDNAVVQKYDTVAGTDYIATGIATSVTAANTITITRGYTRVSGTTDITSILVSGFATIPTGLRVVLRGATSGDVFTMPVSTSGNTRLNTALNFTGSRDTAEFIFDGFSWVLMSFSDNS